MSNDLVLDHLLHFPLFSGLEIQQIKKIAAECAVQSLDPGETLITENTKDTSIYLIIKGKVEILKKDAETQDNFIITSLEEGAWIGEMSFYDESPRSCTVITETAVDIIEISKDKLSKLSQHDYIINKINANIINQSNIINRLRRANSTIVNSLQKEKNLLEERNDFGNFFIFTIMTTAIVIFVNHIIAESTSLSNQHFLYSRLFLWSYLLILSVPCFIYILFSRQRLSSFGCTFTNWRKTAIQTGIFVSIFAISMSIISYCNLLIVPDYCSVGFLTYFMHSTLQEFVSKGVVQTSLYRFYGQKKIFLAVLVSSLLFGIIHIHFGIVPVIVTFLFSMVLGFVYYYQKNIFGISIIHALLGYLAFNINLI